MSLVIKQKTVFPPIEAGAYPALCVGVVDLGTHYSQLYKVSKPEVLFIFEFATERIEVDGEDKPRWLSARFSATLGKNSKLLAFLDNWCGGIAQSEIEEGINLGKFVGMAGIANVKQDKKADGSIRNSVAAMSPLMKGFKKPVPENDLILFDIDDCISSGDLTEFEKLPEWMRKIVEESEEWTAAHGEDIEDSDMLDDDTLTFGEGDFEEIEGISFES